MSKPNAEWTHDCQGKQDYDGPIVSISTRYWPQGGGFSAIINGKWEENSDRPEIKPHAKATIVINSDGDGYEDLVSKDFEGETEEQVKKAVEAWAARQWETIAAAVRAALAAKGGQ